MDVEDDDVVIIDKFINVGRVRRDKERLIRSVIDDDECCVLDMDFGVVEVVEIVLIYDLDELVVIGEKGVVSLFFLVLRVFYVYIFFFILFGFFFCLKCCVFCVGCL